MLNKALQTEGEWHKMETHFLKKKIKGIGNIKRKKGGGRTWTILRKFHVQEPNYFCCCCVSVFFFSLMVFTSLSDLHSFGLSRLSLISLTQCLSLVLNLHVLCLLNHQKVIFFSLSLLNLPDSFHLHLSSLISWFIIWNFVIFSGSMKKTLNAHNMLFL